jgi:hypothetical protein
MDMTTLGMAAGLYPTRGGKFAVAIAPTAKAIKSNFRRPPSRKRPDPAR